MFQNSSKPTGTKNAQVQQKLSSVNSALFTNIIKQKSNFGQKVSIQNNVIKPHQNTFLANSQYRTSSVLNGQNSKFLKSNIQMSAANSKNAQYRFIANGERKQFQHDLKLDGESNDYTLNQSIVLKNINKVLNNEISMKPKLNLSKPINHLGLNSMNKFGWSNKGSKQTYRRAQVVMMARQDDNMEDEDFEIESNVENQDLEENFMNKEFGDIGTPVEKIDNYDPLQSLETEKFEGLESYMHKAVAQMRDLEEGGKNEGPKENFKTFSCNINLTDLQRGQMYKFMNEGEIGMLLTYVEMLQLSSIDKEKMKKLINEWPKEIAIIGIYEERQSLWIPDADNQRLLDMATENDDGSFTMIPEGPPVEEVDMMDHLRSQGNAVAAKDKLIECIKHLPTTKDHKISLVKYLEGKLLNGKPKRQHPEKIVPFCEYLEIEQKYVDDLQQYVQKFIDCDGLQLTIFAKDYDDDFAKVTLPEDIKALEESFAASTFKIKKEEKEEETVPVVREDLGILNTTSILREERKQTPSVVMTNISAMNSALNEVSFLDKEKKEELMKQVLSRDVAMWQSILSHKIALEYTWPATQSKPQWMS